MSVTANPSQLAARPAVVQLIPLTLLPLLWWLPPETRGESMAASAVLFAVLAAAVWPQTRHRDQRLLLAAAALLLPSLWAAQAPGPAVTALAMWGGAAALGLCGTAFAGSRMADVVTPAVVALAGGGVAAHGVYQRLWGLNRLAVAVAADPTVPDREAVLARLASGRAFAAFATPAALGAALALALPVTVGWTLDRRGAPRYLGAGLVALQLAGLLSTSSATAVAALGAATAVALLRGGRGRPVALVGLILTGLTLVVFGLFRGDELLSLRGPQSAWRLRAGNLRAAAEMSRDHPWIGTGPGGFAERYPGYRRAGDNETRHAHNLPLELTAELGGPRGAWLSGLFFLYFLGPLLRRGSVESRARRGLQFGLAAFALHNLADFSAFMPSLLWSSSLLRGLLAHPALEGQQAESEGGEDRARSERGRASGFRRPVLGGVALGLAVVAAVVCALQGLATFDRRAARRAYHADEPQRAASLARRATGWAPWDVDAALALARIELAGIAPGEEQVEHRVRVAAWVERAVRLSPQRPATRALRAELRLGAGDYPGAYADLNQAALLYPAHPGYQRERDRVRDWIEAGFASDGVEP